MELEEDGTWQCWQKVWYRFQSPFQSLGWSLTLSTCHGFVVLSFSLMVKKRFFFPNMQLQTTGMCTGHANLIELVWLPWVFLSECHISLIENDLWFYWVPRVIQRNIHDKCMFGSNSCQKIKCVKTDFIFTYLLNNLLCLNNIQTFNLPHRQTVVHKTVYDKHKV